MTNDDLATRLKERFFALKKQRQAALETADNILEEQKRVRAAYFALTGRDEDMADAGTEATPVVEPRRRRANREPVERTLSADDIEQQIRAVFFDRGRVSFDELRQRVGDVAKGRGCSRKGLHIRMRRLLREGHYEENETGWAPVIDDVRATLAQIADRSIEVAGQPMKEPDLRTEVTKRAERLGMDGNLEAAFNDVLKSGAFAFNGAAWARPAQNSASAE